jgi:hypothetical protein
MRRDRELKDESGVLNDNEPLDDSPSSLPGPPTLNLQRSTS